MEMKFNIDDAAFDSLIENMIRSRLRKMLNENELMDKLIGKEVGIVVNRRVNESLSKIDINKIVDTKITEWVKNVGPNERAIGNSLLKEINRQVTQYLQKDIDEINRKTTESLLKDEIEAVKYLNTVKEKKKGMVVELDDKGKIPEGPFTPDEYRKIIGREEKKPVVYYRAGWIDQKSNTLKCVYMEVLERKDKPALEFGVAQDILYIHYKEYFKSEMDMCIIVDFERYPYITISENKTVIREVDMIEARDFESRQIESMKRIQARDGY